MEQPYNYGVQEGYTNQQQQGYGDTNESEKPFFPVAVARDDDEFNREAPCD